MAARQPGAEASGLAKLKAVGVGFAIAAPGDDDQVDLSIYDITGRRVASVRGRGGEELIWEGNDDAGTAVRPGVYVYRLVSGTHRQAGRWVVLR